MPPNQRPARTSTAATKTQADAPPTGDELAEQGVDPPKDDEPKAPVEDAEPEAVVDELPPLPAPEPHPEPTIVGHGVVQDNVSHPGEQHSLTPDGKLLSKTTGQ